MKKISRRIKEYRIKKGLKQMEFASMLGISPSYLSLIEKGKREVNLKVLQKLIKATGIDFSKEILELPREKEEGIPEFRLAHKLKEKPSLKKSPALHRFFEFVKLYGELENMYDEFIEPPSLSIPSHLLSSYNKDKNKGMEEIANFVRKELNLGTGPITSLDTVLEASGIKVFSFPVEKNDVSGCVILHSDSGPAIFYNWNEVPSRMAFTLSHELGHIVFAENETIVVDKKINEEKDTGRESTINHFASAFLMPESLYRHFWFKIVHDKPSMEHFNILKDIFNVSYSAVLFRAVFLNLIDFATYHRLKLPHTGHYYRENKYRFPEGIPLRFRYLLAKAINDGKLKRSGVKKRLNLTEKQLKSLLFEE